MARGTAIEQIAAFVSRPGIAAGSEDALRRHVTDIVGAWIAGRAIAEGQALTRFALGDSVLDRLAINIACARASEIDDIHLGSLTTPGAAVVMAALTLAAENDASAADLSDAIAGGYDALIRLGLAIGGAWAPSRGIWASYFAAPFGVAAVAARLWKLNADQTAHALALAVTLASPSAGHQHGAHTSRWLAFGLMARSGAAAAQAAQAGFIADPDILESNFLNAAYGIKPDLAAFSSDLGAQLCVNDLSFKPWCAARQTMAGAQAMCELVAEGLSPWDILDVTIAIPPLHVKMVDHGVQPGDRTSHLTSLPYQMALAALSPDAMMDVAQTPEASSAPIETLMGKIKIQGDETLSAAYPKEWHARITVRTASGLREKRVTAIPGEPARAFDDTETRHKFLRLAVPVMGERDANQALAGAWDVLNKTTNAKAILRTTTHTKRGTFV